MGTKRKQSHFHPDSSRARGLELQPRDLLIIKQVMEDRFLTAQQIAQLFFPSYEMAKKRLQKLWNAGFLKREYAPVSFGSSPALYCLTAVGKQLLLEHGVVPPGEMRWHKDSNRNKLLFKQHEIAVNDLKIAFLTATRAINGLSLYHFGKGADYYDQVANTEPEKGEKEYLPIRPDGFIVLENQTGCHNFFLEVDRGTMTLKRIRAKLRGYRQYFFGGGFFAKYGQEGFRKEDYSFRVLMTCPSEETRNNRLEQACAIGSNTMCWFAVQAEAAANPLGATWIRGKEYKEALQTVRPETEYDWQRSHDKSERDRFIREKVALQTLF